MTYFPCTNEYLYEARGGAEGAEQLRVTGTATPAQDREDEEEKDKMKKKKESTQQHFDVSKKEVMSNKAQLLAVVNRLGYVERS